ncbi:uncharacterized protein LOC135339515 [Halichondria panicea]|uniref:uncharacterized protein LOC135339515 n=1 Tax=Halichondria panicea TaxID=6063 RepID=UPI00312B8D3D
MSKQINSRILTNLVLWAIYIAQIGSKLKVQATPGLILPAEREIGLGCIPEGMTVSYECTVTDPTDSPVANTVWLGTAFNCHSAASATTNNRITLAHSQFQLGAVAGDCGDLSAMIIRFIGNEYTSRLVLTNTTGLNGMTVICTLSDKAAGNDTVKIGASPPPPRISMVEVTSTSSFTVSWTPPSDISNVGSYVFTVTGEDCGCVNTNVSSDITSVICSDYMVNGQTCYFEVSTISKDCGFNSESVNESVSLMVPPTPEHFMVTFTEDELIVVGFMQPIVPHLAITYTVMVGTNFSRNFTKVTCNDTSRRCNLTIPNPSNSYNVSVVASNIFGSGPPALYFECNPEDLGSNQTSLRGQGMVNVSNGLIHYSGVSPDSIATLQCNDGYRANSFLNRTCMFDGQWSEGALECVIVDGETISPHTMPACPLYCAVLVGVFVLILIIVCIAIALYILKKSGRECFASINTSDKIQLSAVNRESPTTNESPLSSVDTQPSNAKINVNRSEPSKSTQVDTYANPEDFIKTPPYMQPQKNERAEDQGEVPKSLNVAITDELPCAQYESIEVARPVKVTSTQPSQEMYSEVFDALPKGKSTIIVKKVTVTN